MANRSQIEGILTEFYSARQRNDPKGCSAHFHRDCRLRIVGSSELGSLTSPVNGREAAERMLEHLCANWDFAEFRTLSIHVDGDTVFSHRKGYIRHIPTEYSFEAELIDMIMLRDGQLFDFSEFIDSHHIARILGLHNG